MVRQLKEARPFDLLNICMALDQMFRHDLSSGKFILLWNPQAWASPSTPRPALQYQITPTVRSTDNFGWACIV